MTLLEFRDLMKFTNAQLARFLGVSNASVHHWLNGIHKPSHDHKYIIIKKTKGKVTIF